MGLGFEIRERPGFDSPIDEVEVKENISKGAFKSGVPEKKGAPRMWYLHKLIERRQFISGDRITLTTEFNGVYASVMATFDSYNAEKKKLTVSDNGIQKTIRLIETEILNIAHAPQEPMIKEDGTTGAKEERKGKLRYPVTAIDFLVSEEPASNVAAYEVGSKVHVMVALYTVPPGFTGASVDNDALPESAVSTHLIQGILVGINEEGVILHDSPELKPFGKVMTSGYRLIPFKAELPGEKGGVVTQAVGDKSVISRGVSFWNGASNAKKKASDEAFAWKLNFFAKAKN